MVNNINFIAIINLNDSSTISWFSVNDKINTTWKSIMPMVPNQLIDKSNETVGSWEFKLVAFNI